MVSNATDRWPLILPGSGPPPFPLDPEVEPSIPRRSLARRLAAIGRRAYLEVVDTGVVPGLVPLETHLALCGFPRSGTSMLQLMTQSCYSGCRTYPVETVGYLIAQRGWRNHTRLITKRPNDIFWVSRLFEWYEARSASVRIVMMIRDPRAVLTSRYKALPGYYVSPKVWHAYYAHFLHHRDDPRVLVIRYEELVRSPDAVQDRISDYAGMTPDWRFSQFHRRLPSDLAGPLRDALNGVRAPDPANIDRWRAPEHQERIRWLLQAIPALPAVLVQLGYEPDLRWVSDYE